MSASHISVEITSRSVRPRSRARATQETIEAGLSVSSVEQPRDLGAPERRGASRRELELAASSSPGAGGLAPMIASTPSQLSAMPALARRAGDVGVEGAVEHARGVLGAGQVASQPEQLLGDPGQHQLIRDHASTRRCCCCCWAWLCQPP